MFAVGGPSRGDFPSYAMIPARQRVCSALYGDGAYSSRGMSRSEAESRAKLNGKPRDEWVLWGDRGAAGSSGKPGAGKGEKIILLCACTYM